MLYLWLTISYQLTLQKRQNNRC